MFLKAQVITAKYFTLLRAVLYARRFRNLVSAAASFLMRNTRIGSFPVHAQIEPTNRCNLKCALCLTGSGRLMREKGDLSFDGFKKIIQGLEENIIYLSLYNLGEPFLNPEIFKMVEYSKRKKIFVRVSTNGYFQDTSHIGDIISCGIDELVVSLDCANAKIYREYKISDGFQRVVENTRLIMEKRGKGTKPFVSLQMLVMKDTENQIADFKKLARSLGVDRAVIKPVRVNFAGMQPELSFLPQSKSYIRKYYLNNEKRKPCYRPWLSSVILWDGSVVPCCFDMQASLVFGDALEADFGQIWNNREYSLFRRQITKDINEIRMCRECSLMGILDNLNFYG